MNTSQFHLVMSLKPSRKSVTSSRTISTNVKGYTDYVPNGYTNLIITGEPAFVSRLEFLDSADSAPRSRDDKPCDHYKMAAENYHTSIGWTSYNHVTQPPGSGDYATYLTDSIQPIWEAGGSPNSPESQLGPFMDPTNTDFYEGVLLLPKLFAGNDDVSYKVANEFIDLAELQDRGFQSMLPGIKPELSLINSVYELKDFAHLPQMIKRIMAIPRKGGKTLRKIYRGAAELYLNDSFNIQPLVADIFGLTKALRNVQFQITELLKREGIDQVRHYSCPLGPWYEDKDDIVVVTNPLGSELDVPFRCHRIVKYSDASFYATIRYNFVLRDFERESARVRGLLDALGVNVNPQIIWNALKWSFVVDWVLGVSQWLKQFTLRNIEPQCNILDYCYSTRVDRTIETLLENDRGAYMKAMSVTVSRIHETAYKRVVPGVIDLSSSFRTSGLSPKEFSLIGALYFSRR